MKRIILAMAFFWNNIRLRFDRRWRGHWGYLNACVVIVPHFSCNRGTIAPRLWGDSGGNRGTVASQPWYDYNAILVRFLLEARR